jgi:hypothetical protein
MCSLLAIELVCVGGFVLVQVTGGVGRMGRLLARVGAGLGVRHVDGTVREFYRSHGGAFLASVACHFGGWLVGAVEVLLILRALEVPAGAGGALVVEALGTGVRFATFFVPASLGTLEGANAAAFAALGWAASDGLAFSLVRRGRQVLWIAVGVLVLATLGAGRSAASRPAASLSAPVE